MVSIFRASSANEFSIVDPVQDQLNSTLVQNNTFNPSARKYILSLVNKLSKYTKIHISKVWVLGSSLTYQHTPDSDIDVTLFIDKSTTPEELVLLNKEVAQEFNDQAFIENHPINFHFVAGEYNKFKADAIYDLTENRWIKTPQKFEDSEMQQIINSCKGIEEFQEILEEYNVLKQQLEGFSGSQEEFQEILEQAFWVSHLFYQIKDIRREDFNSEEDRSLPSANFRCSNIIFKLLEKYGFDELASNIASFFEQRLKH